MKERRAVIILLQFICIYFAVYYVHVQYFKVDVVLYSAIFDGLIATLIVIILLNTTKYFNIYTLFEKVLLVTIVLLFSVMVSISVPTIIDRSLSFYLLEKIQQHGGSVRLSSIDRIFTEEYVAEHRLMEIRLTEQVESGTILIEDECIFLTRSGDKLSTYSRFFRKNLLPKNRLIGSEYTDDLTDPFRNGISNHNYQCKH